MYTHICENCGKEYKNQKEKSKYCSKECKYKGISSKRIIDLNGQKFGRLTVLSLKERSNKEKLKWVCKCECGNIVEVLSNNLLRGTTKSCGCLHKEISTELCKKFKIYTDLVGQVFNDLTVIEEVESGLWKCKCICGNFIEVPSRKIS